MIHHITLPLGGSEPRRRGGFYLRIAVLLILAALTAFPTSHLLADDSPESLSGFSASETYDIVPGSPLDVDESFFVRSLYRVAKVSSQSLGKFSQSNGDVTWQQLLERARDFRFWVFTRDATLERLTILKFPANSEPGISGVYLAACRSDDGQPFFLICRSAPSRLPRNEPLKEPIRFSGFFYNTVRLGAEGNGLELLDRADPQNENEDEPQEVDLKNVAPLFVVNRFAWFPKAVDEEDATEAKAKISPGNVELASQGVDIGLFDYVRKRNSKPLAKQDAGCFYQMLHAASVIGQAGAGEANEESSSPVGFVQLVGAAKKHIGARVTVTGSLRQCVRITVPPDAPISNAGQRLEHYYQVSLFPDLGGRKVVTRTGKGMTYHLIATP